MIRTSTPPIRDIGHALGAWPEQLGDMERDQSQVVMVPISSLRPSDSPRLAGQNIEHVRALAESEATLPPIIVNRSTMCVIDGMHRLRAAALSGGDEIQVRFIDCDDEDAFVLAVEANIAHGLPLSLADRTAAAARIVNSHPEWSDRAIASTAGLSAKTVAAIRRRATEERSSEEIPHLNTGVVNGRVGLDGRVRPPNLAEGRRIASVLMNDKPDASLREIAETAGISLGTAHDVRDKLRRGENPILPKQRGGERWEGQAKREGPAVPPAPKVDSSTRSKDRNLIFRSLARDPSLRFPDSGRALLRLLAVLAIAPEDWRRLIDNVPAHCTPMVSDAACACAEMWRDFAEQLERKRSVRP